MTIGDTEFSVMGSSGEEYLIEFSAQGDSYVVITAGDSVPVETTVTVDAGRSITTIQVGTDTYSVTYDENGEVDSVTLDPSLSRRTQQAEIADRRLQSCEQFCAADANQLCGALAFGCADSTDTLATLLGPLCDDLDNLCTEAGILQGCDRTCAPGEWIRMIVLTLFFCRAVKPLQLVWGRYPRATAYERLQADLDLSPTFTGEFQCSPFLVGVAERQPP